MVGMGAPGTSATLSAQAGGTLPGSWVDGRLKHLPVLWFWLFRCVTDPFRTCTEQRLFHHPHGSVGGEFEKQSLFSGGV